eukprot:53564-Pyramimonas_sp.AAC.1
MRAWARGPERFAVAEAVGCTIASPLQTAAAACQGRTAALGALSSVLLLLLLHPALLLAKGGGEPPPPPRPPPSHPPSLSSCFE